MKRSRTVIRELSRNESAKSLTASNLDSQWERTGQPAGLRSLPQSPSHTGDQATAVSSAGRGSIREKALGRWTTYWEESQEQLGWRRKWQPTPVLLLGESLGQRSLVGYSLWSRRVGHDWLTHTQNWGDTWWCKSTLYLLSHLLQEAGWARQHLGGRMACPSPHPLWKSWGLSAYNGWPWANKRLSCLKQNKRQTKQKNS